MAQDQPSESFIRELRRALRHLYDPDELRRSALKALLPVDEHEGPISLQRLLVQAIEALKPGSTVSTQSTAWRTYRTLSARYIQQFSQEEVAKGLGVSLRQMRRQDNLALRVLAQHLWTTYDMPRLAPAREGLVESLPAADEEEEDEELSREQELQWLEQSVANEPVALAEMIEAVLRTVAPLVQDMHVDITYTVPGDLPPLVVQASTLRQALLSILTAAIHQALGGRVAIQVVTHSQEREVQVWVQSHAHSAAAMPPAGGQADDDFSMAQQLVQLLGGVLEMLPGEDDCTPFCARLTLHATEQAPVLVIDDNADALQLLERYLAGTRYAFLGARDPEQGLALAEKLSPQAIVLDIMLPGVDGWEMLGRLREHPCVGETPIIVCTILPQERLALALGAAAFIRKPISRTALLSLLDQLCARPRPGSG